MSKNLTKEFVLANTNGLHVRTSAVFVQTAMQFNSEILVQNLSSGQESDGKSVMGMLMLAAPKGTKLRVTVNGADAAEAMSALEDLIARGFDED